MVHPKTRADRRRNFIAKDLRTPKYSPKVIPNYDSEGYYDKRARRFREDLRKSIPDDDEDARQRRTDWLPPFDVTD